MVCCDLKVDLTQIKQYTFKRIVCVYFVAFGQTVTVHSVGIVLYL